MPTKISKTYTPSPKEKYMCAKHKAYFRKALAEWKNELIEQNNRIIFGNDDDNAASADVVDQATSFANKTVEMRTVNRHKKLMKKIDAINKMAIKTVVTVETPNIKVDKNPNNVTTIGKVISYDNINLIYLHLLTNLIQ